MSFSVLVFFLCARRNAARGAVVACEVQLEAAEVFCGVLRLVARLGQPKLWESNLLLFLAQRLLRGGGMGDGYGKGKL